MSVNERRTVLSDSLESEFARRSPNPDWRFRVRETTCAKDDCNCELVYVEWFGHGFAGKLCSTPSGDKKVIGENKPLSKIWEAKEIRRRHVGPFVQGMLDGISGMRD